MGKRMVVGNLRVVISSLAAAEGRSSSSHCFSALYATISFVSRTDTINVCQSYSQ